MRFFNFLWRRPKRTSPKAMIESIIEFIPHFYKDKIQYKQCLEYLEYNEWELALDSLIDLANESGNYFSENFWLELANVADRMKLNEQSIYCRKQILKNKEQIPLIKNLLR